MTLTYLVNLCVGKCFRYSSWFNTSSVRIVIIKYKIFFIKTFSCLELVAG